MLVVVNRRTSKATLIQIVFLASFVKIVADREPVDAVGIHVIQLEAGNSFLIN